MYQLDTLKKQVCKKLEHWRCPGTKVRAQTAILGLTRSVRCEMGASNVVYTHSWGVYTLIYTVYTRPVYTVYNVYAN